MNTPDHIAIAVRSIDQAAVLLESLLGIPLTGRETVEEQGVRVGFFAAPGLCIELLEPLHDQSSTARFLERKGEGLHHIAWQVDNLEEHLRDLAAKGIRLIDTHPRPGARGKKTAFVHPSSGNGVLWELTEKGSRPEDNY